jgi:pyrroloquinoline quinone biosynthesis protein D
VNVAADSVLKKVVGADGSRFGADFVVLDPSGRTLRGLNTTAARVWALLDGQRSVREIAETIAADFKVQPERVLDDVIAFVSALSDKCLVEATGSGAATVGGPR